MSEIRRNETRKRHCESAIGGRSNLILFRPSVSIFGHSCFEFVSKFDIGASNLSGGSDAGMKVEIRISKSEGNPKDQIRMFET
jgi:hypothetical protein